MSATNGKKVVQVAVEDGLSTVTLGGAIVEVSADGNRVTAYTDEGVETKAATTNGEAAAKGTQINISEKFNIVVLNDVTIERAADGHLVISAPGIVVTKPAAANDTAKAFNKVAPQIGDKLADGWFLAGPDPENPDNDLLVEALATRLGTTTWYKAVEHAKALKKAGFETARLPSVKQLGSIFENVVKPGKNDNAQLVTRSSAVAKLHWSSETPPEDRWARARIVSLADGYQHWHYRDNDALSAVCVRSEPRPAAKPQ